MKTRNRKYASLLIAFAILIAYAVPFNINALAEDSLWDESIQSNDAYIELTAVDQTLVPITGNYTFIAENFITANVTTPTKFDNDRVLVVGNFGGKGQSTINGNEYGNVLRTKGTANYIAFTVPANATVTVYGKNSSSSEDRYFVAASSLAATNDPSSNIAYSEDNATVFTFKVTEDTTVYISSYGSANHSGGDAYIAGFTVEVDAPEETDAPVATEEPEVTDTPDTTAAPDVTDAPVNTQTPTAKPEATPTVKPTASPVVTSTPVATKSPGDLTPDEKAVIADAEALQLNAISQTAVYADIDLDMKGENGSTITWESSDKKYIDIKMVSHIKRNYTGVVTRPKEEECTEDGGVPVTLTATLKKGSAVYTKTFDVSVRQWNPIYYNDFQSDVGKEAEGTYKAIANNVKAANGDTFRGIRVDTLTESRSFDAFEHGDQDTPTYFDKRLMSVPVNRDNSDGEENFAFYYNMYNAYGGSTTYNPLWIKLIDPSTGTAPEGIIMMNMDIYIVSSSTTRFNMGFGTSKAAQMCRFVLYNGTNSALGYKGGGLLRTFSNESSMDFMGGKNGYCFPLGEWVRATIVANSDSHKWDFYFDGMQVATGMDFRNAEDIIPTIEFTMDRSYDQGSYYIDNIYVENMTEDYAATYWDALTLDTVPYDKTNDVYTVSTAKPFMLLYQGSGGMSGNLIKWGSSDKDVIEVSTERISADELINYGYTTEQIAELKSTGHSEVTVILAKPNDKLTEDKTVTLTASMNISSGLMKKDFNFIVKANASDSDDSDYAKALADADAISGIRNGETVVSNLTLPSKGSINGSDIVWKSSNGSVISANGTVIRPATNSVAVTLTATVKYGTAVAYKIFNVTVSGKNPGANTGGGSGGGGGGSSVNGNSSSSIAVSNDIIPQITPTNQPQEIKRNPDMPAFDDLDKTPWAKEAIEYLFVKDIVNGYGNGLYGVEDNVTREQFVRMLLTALDIRLVINDEKAFKDVEEDSWYANYVNAALKLGIVSGISEDEFGIGRPISRQDMAVMCERALGLISENPEIIENDEPEVADEPEETNAPEDEISLAELMSELTFVDREDISDYALKAVVFMEKAGYLSGDNNGNFAPKKSLTRAETATVLYRILIQEGI